MTTRKEDRMESISTRRIARSGLIAAIYVAVTVLLSAFSYGGIQFRVAEAMMLLCLFSKDYIFSLSLGCFIANIYSTVGVIDTVIGTSATLFAAVCIYYLRDHLNLVTASVFPILFNAVLVGLELRFLTGAPLLLSMGGIALGEFVCVTVFGGILFKILKQHQSFMRLMGDEIDDRTARK